MFQGMAYLGQKNIVHRDLAARNVLVANEYNVKISDFGLAQVMGSSNYYVLKTNRDLPIRWWVCWCYFRSDEIPPCMSSMSNKPHDVTSSDSSDSIESRIGERERMEISSELNGNLWRMKTFYCETYSTIFIQCVIIIEKVHYYHECYSIRSPKYNTIISTC